MLLSLIGYDDPVIVLLNSLSALLYHYSVSNANVIMSGQCFCYESYNVCCVKLCIGQCVNCIVIFSLFLILIPNTCLINRILNEGSKTTRMLGLN